MTVFIFDEMAPRRRCARRRTRYSRGSAGSAGFWQNVGRMIKNGIVKLGKDVREHPMKYWEGAKKIYGTLRNAYNAASGTSGLYRKRRGGRRRKAGGRRRRTGGAYPVMPRWGTRRPISAYLK